MRMNERLDVDTLASDITEVYDFVKTLANELCVNVCDHIIDPVHNKLDRIYNNGPDEIVFPIADKMERCCEISDGSRQPKNRLVSRPDDGWFIDWEVSTNANPEVVFSIWTDRCMNFIENRTSYGYLNEDDDAITEFLSKAPDDLFDEYGNVIDKKAIKKWVVDQFKDLNASFKKMVQKTQEFVNMDIKFISAGYVYDYEGNTELDGFDGFYANRDYEKVLRRTREIANSCVDEYYFPIFIGTEEEYRNGEMTDHDIVRVVTQDGSKLVPDFLPKTITHKGSYGSIYNDNKIWLPND